MSIVYFPILRKFFKFGKCIKNVKKSLKLLESPHLGSSTVDTLALCSFSCVLENVLNVDTLHV